MNTLFTHHLDLPPGESLDPKTLPAHGGVYCLADEADRPILLACGENLRRVVTHRLKTSPADGRTRRANLAGIARRIHWRESFSRFETALAHWQIARALYPKAYRKMLGFGPAWFLHVVPDADFPRFAAVREIRQDGGRIIGPYATRKDADEWIHMLEEAFDLCRYHPILEQAPHGEACAYAEMGKCPAPCDGSISMDVYRRLIADAFRFTLGRHEPRLAALRSEMQTAASRQAYEKAASLRKTIDSTAAIIHRPEYRHATDLHAASWLVLQRGGPARRSPDRILVRPFHVWNGTIQPGEPVSLAKINTAIPDWLTPSSCATTRGRRAADFSPRGRSNTTVSQGRQQSYRNPESPLSTTNAPPDPTARSEAFWLLSKFLFQNEKAPGLFYHTDQLPPPDRLAEAAYKRFGPQPRDESSENASTRH
ncbi:MAG: UvrB/UvrC motif-containing protein [Phycisphaerae bacterium]